jgi:hypothetical protein
MGSGESVMADKVPDIPAYEILAATALAGLVWEATKAYRATCPPLSDLRSAPSNHPMLLQDLIDTDITVGIPALLAGAVASWFMRSWWPVAIVAVALGATAGYHHSILKDTP